MKARLRHQSCHNLLLPATSTHINSIVIILLLCFNNCFEMNPAIQVSPCSSSSTHSRRETLVHRLLYTHDAQVPVSKHWREFKVLTPTGENQLLASSFLGSLQLSWGKATASFMPASAQLSQVTDIWLDIKTKKANHGFHGNRRFSRKKANFTENVTAVKSRIKLVPTDALPATKPTAPKHWRQ